MTVINMLVESVHVKAYVYEGGLGVMSLGVDSKIMSHLW